MSKYNKCEGCELWNGHHCIGARSYEPNADEHRIICNEHIAKQFWVVYQQLHRSEARVKELEGKLNAQFTEMEEKLTAEEMNNFELRKKLKIAEEFIEFLANGKCSSGVCKPQGREYKNCLVCFENKAQETLQKMKEVKQWKNL